MLLQAIDLAQEGRDVRRVQGLERVLQDYQAVHTAAQCRVEEQKAFLEQLHCREHANQGK